MQVLITRRKAMNDRTAAILTAAGHQPVSCPLVDYVDTGADIPTINISALIVTSQAALDILAERIGQETLKFTQTMPIFAVGEATALSAKELGFTDVRCAGGNAASLIELIAGFPKIDDLPMLYLAGIDRSVDIASKLAGKNIDVHLLEIYRAELLDPGKETLECALKKIRSGCALLYSVRTAIHLLELCSKHKLEILLADMVFVAISQKVANVVSERIDNMIIVAKRPDQQAMLDVIEVMDT